MKKSSTRFLALTVAVCAHVLFAFELVWSLVPLGGNTLPQWVGAVTGMSFTRTALLVSFLEGLTPVAGLLVPLLVPARSDRSEGGEHPLENGGNC